MIAVVVVVIVVMILTRYWQFSVMIAPLYISTIVIRGRPKMYEHGHFWLKSFYCEAESYVSHHPTASINARASVRHPILNSQASSPNFVFCSVPNLNSQESSAFLSFVFTFC